MAWRRGPSRIAWPWRIATWAAALGSLLAGSLHGALVQEHLREWWGYGLFFLAAALAQGLYGLVLFALPPRAPEWAQERWPRMLRRMYLAGLAGNLAILLLYTVTRTIGIPLLGPQAGTVEDVDSIDLIALAAETITVLGLAFLAWRPAARPRA